MPYMLPSTSETCFEKFNEIVEKYKHVIESNATARCMIGFTAAAFIRNEGDIDIGLVESWFQSLELDVVDSSRSVDGNKVNRILHVVKETTTGHYYGEEEVDCITTDESENEELLVDLEEYKLNRFTSESNCTYLPKEATVVDHVLFPLDEEQSWS